MKIRPWFWLPPLWAHNITFWGLKILHPLFKPQKFPWRPFAWRNLLFHNRLGIAGGVDKNAEAVTAFWSFGAGFIEVGTVTPRPQKANPGVTLLRFEKTTALWNKMGFPNDGMDKIHRRLNKLPKPHFTPVFVNIGKNRDTENENAIYDYTCVMEKMRDVADVYVINISSPNTKSLRDLLNPKELRPFLSELNQKKLSIPLLLKLSPDMNDELLKEVMDISHSSGVDGWILTNTTTQRQASDSYPIEGGISGQPLAERSKAVLKLAIQHLGERRKDKLIVSVGGIMNTADARERLELGADLVAVYSTLVYNGPSIFREVGQRE